MTPSMTAGMARQMVARWSAKTPALWSKVAVRSGLADGPLLTQNGSLFRLPSMEQGWENTVKISDSNSK